MIVYTAMPVVLARSQELHRVVQILKKCKKATPTFVFFVYYLKSEKERENVPKQIICLMFY